MAATAVSSHNFAWHITGQLDGTREAHQQNHEAASPATMEELKEAAAVLDSEIQSIKAQVYKKLLANFTEFTQSYESSLELKGKIDELLAQADDMTSQTIDPESGLRQKVMSALVNHHEISYKVQENDSIVEGLKHFSRVDDILSRYEDCMDAGQILQAGHCIRQVVRERAFIDSVLDVQLEKRILKLRSQSGSSATPGSIRWHELVRALALLEVAPEKLRPLQKSILRNLLQPLIQYHRNSTLQLNTSGTSYAIAEGSSISLSVQTGQDISNNDDVLMVFTYIHQDIFLNEFSSSQFNAEQQSSDTEILVYLVGRPIAVEACSMILEHHLVANVPHEIDELIAFGSITTKVIAFEDALIAMEADRSLRDFVESIDVHYTNRKRDTLLKQGRAIIMSDDFTAVSVKDLDENDELEQERNSWSISDPDTDLKESSISIKAKRLIDMIVATLQEAKPLSADASPYLYHATRSLVDLYRVLMPIYHERTLSHVPALAILFYNDCMFIARELEKMNDRFDNGIPGMNEILYDDAIPPLKALAKTWLNMQVQKQREELMQSIDEADGFQDSSVENSYTACERAMKQVIHVFKHLGKAWKPTLSPMTFYKVLGQLLEDVVIRVIKEIEGLVDISEKESHKLAELCGLLFECEDQFDSAGPLIKTVKGDASEDEDPIHFFVPSWEKFQLMTDMLELSFAEIMTRFRAGQLHMFQVRELTNFVCALFADTPLRQRNLEEIESSLMPQ
ncbi:hypothetical protein BGZ94_005084 [Podila epigama]|nr:hypothetical protein BGZ94_005084 [Podila epigama]